VNIVEPTVLRAVRHVPRLGILEGDTVVVRDGSPALWRPIPNAGAVLLAHEEGALEMISWPSPGGVAQRATPRRKAPTRILQLIR
jgi:hypothetical protein